MFYNIREKLVAFLQLFQQKSSKIQTIKIEVKEQEL